MDLPQTRAEWAHNIIKKRLKRLGTGPELTLRANVKIASYSASGARAKIPNYEELSPGGKADALSSLDPLFVDEQHNVATDVQAKYIIDNLDPNQAVDTDVAAVAIGNDDTFTSVSNTALNNEVARVNVGSVTDDPTNLELQTSTTLGSSEQNGTTIKEVGLTDDTADNSGRLLNHALVGPEDKTSAKEITIEIDLIYSPS